MRLNSAALNLQAINSLGELKAFGDVSSGQAQLAQINGTLTVLLNAASAQAQQGLLNGSLTYLVVSHNSQLQQSSGDTSRQILATNTA